MEEIRGRRLTDRESQDMWMRESDNLDILYEELEGIAEACDKFARIYVITADELHAALERSKNEQLL